MFITLRTVSFALVVSVFAAMSMLLLAFIQVHQVIWVCLIILAAVLVFHFVTAKIRQQ